MKDSEDWVRQDAVDQAADMIAAERGRSFDEVKPYQVAKRLGIAKPGGDFYEKVYDWRRRRRADIMVAAIEVPAEASAAFRAALDHFTTDAMAEFARTVRMVAGTLDQSAALRVADAERRRDGSEAERMDLLTLCRQVEAERDAAFAQVAGLTQELTDVRRLVDRLTGRLEQRAIDTAAMLAGRELASEMSEGDAEPDALGAVPPVEAEQVEMRLPTASDDDEPDGDEEPDRSG